VLRGASGGRGPAAPPPAERVGGSGAASAATPSATWTPAQGTTGRPSPATTVRKQETVA
jgi:hypothetical protein